MSQGDLLVFWFWVGKLLGLSACFPIQSTVTIDLLGLGSI